MTFVYKIITLHAFLLDLYKMLYLLGSMGCVRAIKTQEQDPDQKLKTIVM